MTQHPAHPCRVEQIQVTVDARALIADCRDPERFLALCRQCPNYGALWCCPPFDFDWLPRLLPYRSATIFATRITPLEEGLPASAAEPIILAHRPQQENRLLQLERATGGLAFAYAGRCLRCPQGQCTRPRGQDCRHPSLVRPSLEAAGFDVGKILSSHMGISLLWGADGKMPPYLVLVTALFHNGPLPAEEQQLIFP